MYIISAHDFVQFSTSDVQFAEICSKSLFGGESLASFPGSFLPTRNYLGTYEASEDFLYQPIAYKEIQPKNCTVSMSQ